MNKSYGNHIKLTEEPLKMFGQIIKDWRQKISIKKSYVLRAGKHHFIKLVP